MDDKYKELLKNKFGFSNILADGAKNFKYVLGSEFNGSFEVFAPHNYDNFDISGKDFYIVKLNDEKYLYCTESITWFCDITIKNQNWHEFGFFVEEFNDLMEKTK